MQTVTVPATYTLNVDFYANGGDTVPSSQSRAVSSANNSVNVSLNITPVLPTRVGYDFVGWAYSSDGAVMKYPNDGIGYTFGRVSSGSYYNDNTDTMYYTAANQSYTFRLYAVWKVSAGVLDSVSDTEIGSSGTAAWTKVSNDHTYKLVLSCSGAADVEINNIPAGSESCSFTIPSSWLAALPNSTSATATATLYSYDNGSLVGSTSLTFTVSVPTSVKPTISEFTATPHSANNTVEGWGVAVQGLSFLTLAVSASPGSGASVVNVSFTGHGISQSSAASSGNTAIVTSTGTLSYNVTVTDSRGRTASLSITVTVYEYANPIVYSMDVVRCYSNGTQSDTEGNYLKALPVFVFSSVNGNNSLSVKKIEYRAHGASTWVVGIASATSGSWSAVFGPADITKAYDVKLTITDAVNNTFALEVTAQSVVGFALGLKNDRARFGGPVGKPGLEVDWDSDFHGDMNVDGQLTGGGFMKTLWSSSSGWNSGSITVNGLSNYNLFLVRVDTYAVSVLCTLGRTNLTSEPAYFRGMGGYTSSGSNAVNIYVNATRSGDTLTWSNAYSVKTDGTFNARKVIEIIGII